MEIKRISLIAPKPTTPLGASTRHVVMLLSGLPIVGTNLKQHGYEVRIFFENVKAIDWDFVYSSQVVGFQTMVCTALRTFDFIKRIKAKNERVVTVIGGTFPTSIPETLLTHSDFVVRQEGDETLPDLLNALQTGRDLRKVPGISYKINESKVVHNPDRPLVKDIDIIPDLSLIHGWCELRAWKLVFRLKQHMQIVQTSRGCPFTCSFCTVPMMFNKGTYRVRSIDSVIEEIKSKIAETDCRRFMFVDNYFGAQRPHAKALLRRILEEGIEFNCFAFTRLEVYNDPEFLTLLKQAGFDPLLIGFESFNDGALQSFEKSQTSAQIIEAINTIKAHNLRISGSFIIGSDEDTVDSIRTTIDSAIRYGIDNFTILPLSVIPGRGPTPVPRNRIILPHYDFGTGNYVTIFPKKMKPSTLQKEYIRAYRRVNSIKTAWHGIKQGNITSGVERLFSYLAHRAVIEEMEKRYIPLLYKIEEELYDEQERLLEHKLPPNGVVAEDFILSPEEENQLSVSDIPDLNSITELDQVHTYEMALRKCYGSQF
jgi:pyruvate-formate lyase-activating enzyme